MPSETPPSRRTILVVEDDLEVQGWLGRLLEQQGYAAVFCRKATRVPLAVHQVRPVMVLMDAHLGSGLNGLQVCAILKKAPVVREIPVVMTSGRWLEDEFAEVAVQYGADAFVRKSDLADRLPGLLARFLKDQDGIATAPSSQGAEELRPRGTVVIADDDDDWLALASTWLSDAGHRVIRTSGGESVHKFALTHRPDCIVLDYDLGRMKASDVCRRLQEHPLSRAVPVVVLTAHAGGRAALDHGADLFVAKEGDGAERFLQSVHGAIRRFRWSTGIVVRGDVSLDPRDNRVQIGRGTVQLSAEQFNLLHALVSRSPYCVDRAELFRSVLGREDDGESRALDMLIGRLKTKIGKPAAGRIHHVSGLGWTYEFPATDSIHIDNPEHHLTKGIKEKN
jgi:DNA-binding response OmpR family regulator